MTWAGRRRADGALARLLAGAIDRGGIDGILLDIGAALAAVEDIVGRDMDQGRADGLAGFGQGRRPVAIDGEGELGLALGLVDGGVGGGVDHQIGLLGDHRFTAQRRVCADRSPRGRGRRAATSAGQSASASAVASCPARPITRIRVIGRSTGETQPPAVIAALHGALPPMGILEIPVHRGLEPALEGRARAPSRAHAGHGRIDGIAQIVAGPVGDEADQALARAGAVGPAAIEDGADRAHHLEIAALRPAAEIILGRRACRR